MFLPVVPMRWMMRWKEKLENFLCTTRKCYDLMLVRLVLTQKGEKIQHIHTLVVFSYLILTCFVCTVRDVIYILRVLYTKRKITRELHGITNAFPRK